MNFDLNEEQRIMAETLRRFGEEVLPPYTKKEEFSPELVERMGGLGVFGSAFPQRYGGSDMGFLAHSVACETVSYFDSGLRPLFNTQAMTVPYTIMEWGTAEARERYVADLVAGRKVGCTCFSEPNAGSDLSSIEARVRDAGDHFVLNGTKTWISNGNFADVAVVYASFDRSLKHKGICSIVVETHQKGWTARAIEKLGDKSSPIAHITLDEVIAPKENLLGGWGGGFTVAMTALDRGRISVSSGALGLAQACVDASVRYANERVQFGQKIGQFQLVKGIVAEMATMT